MVSDGKTHCGLSKTDQGCAATKNHTVRCIPEHYAMSPENITACCPSMSGVPILPMCMNCTPLGVRRASGATAYL